MFLKNATRLSSIKALAYYCCSSTTNLNYAQLGKKVSFTHTGDMPTVQQYCYSDKCCIIVNIHLILFTFKSNKCVQKKFKWVENYFFQFS